MPVIAANRIGIEAQDQRFYGHSFICDQWGDFLADYGADESGMLVATIDLAEAARHRAGMGFFRDRRPQLYSRLVEDR
jgi:N-carbamoylputrescine amidase